MEISIAQQSYGKSQVRLSLVKRHDDRHDFTELTVDIELDGDFNAAYTAGDNAKIIPTDTMKNTVYALARQHGVQSIEGFAIALAEHFRTKFDQVGTAKIRIAQSLWSRIVCKGSPHQHAFTGGGSQQNTCNVTAGPDGVCVASGIMGLKVLKTTGSGFSGYHKDAYTTLPETTDRIFATTITADWKASTKASEPSDWTLVRAEIHNVLLDVFANRYSPSVQSTLYEMARAVMAACPQIEEISLRMPNQHHLPAELAKMNLQNDNDIFVPTSEPFGVIRATLRRSG